MAEVPGGVVFAWNRASDPNQSAPLTYNIRVGTTPGGNEVVRSLARPDGVLIVPRAGNCGFQTRRFLRLPRSHGDRLYWSVQSVDAGNVGGVWAREHEEPIGASINTPPRVSGLSDVVAVAGAHLRIPFTVVDDLTPSSLLTVRAWSDDPFRVQVDPGAVGFEADPEAVGAGRRVLGLRLAAGPATRTTVSVLAADYHGAAVVARFVVDAVAPSRIAHLEPVADASESAGAPLRLTGLAGERWLVEESADLREWSPLEEVTVGPDGTLLWVPPASPDPARFFRTRFLAPL